MNKVRTRFGRLVNRFSNVSSRLPGEPIHQDSSETVSPSAFQAWLRVLAHRSLTPPAENQNVVLARAKRAMLSDLTIHMNAMARQDVRTYVRLLAVSDMTALRHLRFAYFDVLCRFESEQAALCKLRTIDGMLA